MIVSDGKVLDFAPQALGETTPSLASGYFYANQGLELAGRFATYAKMYRQQPAIATVVDKIANSAARLSINVWDTTAEHGRTLDTNSDFARLMARPNNRMSSYAFWRWTFSTLDIYGEAFWYKQRDSFGNVVNLSPMHPSRVAVKRDHEGNITYIFTLGVASAGILRVADTEVVAFQRYNPESLMRGLSRLEPLRMTLLSEDAARRATSSWWQRGARPSVVLKHPGELSQNAQDRLKTKFDAQHAGADNMGGSLVLEEGMEAQIIQLNAEEMQYIESRKMNLQEVCMVYDVPPPVVHILDHATFSNITEQMRSMYRDTMTPRLEEVESVIENSLRPEFFGSGERIVKFALDEVLRGDFETRAEAVVKLVTNGVMKPAEARPLFDLPAIDGASDNLYANGALVPLGTLPQAQAGTNITLHNGSTPDGSKAPEDAPEASDTTDEPAPTKSVSVRSIMGRLSRVKANKSELRAKLVEEHKKALTAYFDEQRNALKADGTKAPMALDSKEWNDRLADVLLPLSQATTDAIGQNVANSLGGKYSGDSIGDWLKEDATKSAKNINKTTQANVREYLKNTPDDMSYEDSVDSFFDESEASRPDEWSLTRVVMLAGLAGLVAARLSNATEKTWVTTSDNPRPEHAAMNGETVKLGENFSNGMNGPGDYSGGAEEVANCTCDLQFS